MSRCYPFPPPGYVRNESLIESIKEEVRKDRKHKKKDKNRKERENEADRSKKHRHKRQRRDERANASKKVDDGRELMNSEVEFLEKSCLTVELEHQTSSQNSCDSSLHSNERPKQIQSQPLDGRHNDSEIGKRIRLPCKEQKDHEVMMTNKDQKLYSSWKRLDASQDAPSESVGHLYSTSANEAPRDALSVCQEKKRDPIYGSSREISTKLSQEKKTMLLKDDRKISKQHGKEKSCSSHQETIGSSKLCSSKCPPSMAVQFLNLIENWTPDRVESKLTDSEDQEEWWLFMKFGAKRDHHHHVSNQKTSQGSSSMVWPIARFLPEAEIHALPFTVPF